MTGTLVNFAGILVGSFLGLLLKRGIPEHINQSIMKVEGLGIAIIGLNGVIAAMFRADPATGKLSDSGGLLLLVSLVVGTLTGEFIRIDDHLNNFGLFVERKINSQGFAKGFVTASLIFCIGAMSIIGPINDGLSGDSSILFIKSLLDFTTAIVLASALGVGVAFSAIPVLLWQGAVALLARQISGYITDELLAMICMVGYAIVTVIGANFLCDTKVKTANLLPALLIPVGYYFLFTERNLEMLSQLAWPWSSVF